MSDQYHVSPIRPYAKGHNDDVVGRGKPLGKPRSDKDFKKVNREDDETDQHPEELAAVDDKETSVFDLSAKKGIKSKPSLSKQRPLSDSEPADTLQKAGAARSDDGTVDPDAGDNTDAQLTSFEGEEQPPAPVDEQLQAQALNKNALNKNAVVEGEINRERMAVSIRQSQGESAVPLETDSTTFTSKDRLKSDSRHKEKAQFSQEKADIAYINQNSQVVASIQTKAEEGQDVNRSKTIQELVNQVAESMEVMKSEGRTDTIIRLQHPPILRNADLILTSYQSAHNEVNIAFTNLSNDGKRFLDLQLQNDSLTTALREKDIVVHMLTTTTLTETPTLHSESGRFSREEERRGQRDPEQRKDKQK